MSVTTPITVAYGDGIGSEIMQAVLYILQKAEANIRVEVIEVGEKLYNKNYSSGIEPSSFKSIQNTGILLKAPITTPQGGGYKSLNVTLRKALGLYANVRPAISYHPFISTRHPELDIIVMRENEEDLYSGIEYRHTHNVCESMKLISRTSSEKIIRYAFEYAVKNNRKKVTCLSKDNIMKFSDGLFHKVFDEVAAEYQDVKNEHYIVDIGMAKIATKPEFFDVVVTENLFGDILSDITAEISGSVGLAGSANIGTDFAMFEAIHGSAPKIAGRDIANPSGLIHATIMMLIHIGHFESANLIENAWKKTIEDGIHTADIYNAVTSSHKVGTQDFAKCVCQNLGKSPQKLPIAKYESLKNISSKQNVVLQISTQEKKELVGVDIYINFNTDSAHKVAEKIKKIEFDDLKLHTVSSKGLKLWPRDDDFLNISDHWCCRFFSNKKGNKVVTHLQLAELIKKLSEHNIDFIKVENLYEFDNIRGYSLAQDE